MHSLSGAETKAAGCKALFGKSISLTAWPRRLAQSVWQPQIDMSVRQSRPVTAPPRGGTHSAT